MTNLTSLGRSMASFRHIVRSTLVNLHGKPCSDPVCTVEEYVSRHPVLVHLPSEAIRLGGESLKGHFSMLSKQGMKLISSLTTALHELHEAGLCVCGFDESNMMVSYNITQEMLFHPTNSNKIELKQNLPPGVFATPGLSVFPDIGNLKFRGVEFQQSTPSAIQANYLDAHDLITEKLLQPDMVRAPDEIKHLLKLMKSSEPTTSMGPLLSRHVSLVCFGRRLGLVMTYIPYIRQVLPYVDRDAESIILGEMPYLDDWIERAEKNKFLNLFLNHCQNKYRADPTSLLDFYYDVAVNRMKWCHSPEFETIGGYTTDEVEMVMAMTYPDLLPTIQEALWKTKHLEKAHAS